MNEALINKKAKYRTMAIRFTNKINNFVRVLDKCEVKARDSLETIIFKKYLELGDVVKVADYINNQGHRIMTNSYKGERKYISNDIADIINNPNSSVDNELVNAIKEMKDINRMLIKMNAKRLLKA
ncbi:hypothetical protein [Clostridium magnum]|uniref:Uncharacterized protein n=1 Tax=Clostridium magnum DSM 2767 TaxID=1121326 RepID=A0A162QM47_9CLOT|nr:hypothetical protein [Clostridium magnum]KZL88701.1 hypothetical protein CLMAG_59900 [Clostridium magnum DSM 2767]SHJ44576.1 hypothetical protein SAMN02745944_05980 [Clostridium magnum DSM 2767]